MRKRRGKRENQLVSDEEKMETRGRCRHKDENGVIKKKGASVLQLNKHLHAHTGSLQGMWKEIYGQLCPLSAQAHGHHGNGE